MGHMFKKSNKIGKKYNVGVKNKYTSLLKEIKVNIIILIKYIVIKK